MKRFFSLWNLKSEHKRRLYSVVRMNTSGNTWWDKVVQRTEAATQKGALKSIETSCTTVEDKGVNVSEYNENNSRKWIIRLVGRLAEKTKNLETDKKDTK